MFAMSQQAVFSASIQNSAKSDEFFKSINVLHSDNDVLWIKTEGVWAGKASWDLVNIWCENQKKLAPYGAFLYLLLI
jgi:hypothetical protein